MGGFVLWVSMLFDIEGLSAFSKAVGLFSKMNLSMMTIRAFDAVRDVSIRYWNRSLHIP